MTIVQLASRITVLEKMIEEIHTAIVLGREPAPPGVDEYRKAMEVFAHTGDQSLLRAYLKRGGKPYPPEVIYPEG